MKIVNVGERVRLFRSRKKISQLKLECLMNASHGSISRIEGGVVNPTKETLFEIAKALRISSLETAFLIGIDVSDIISSVKSFDPDTLNI